MTSSRPWRATVAPISESTSSQRPTSVFRNDAAPPARVMISSVESPPSRGSAVISAMTTLAPSPAKPMAIARPIPELAPVTTAIFPASRLDMGFDSYKDLGTRAPSSKDIPVSDVIQPDLDLAASLFEALSGATRRGRGIVRDSYGAGEQAAHDLVRSAAASGSFADPGIPRAAHRAGSDAGRARNARRRGERHPRLQALPQCALHWRVWPFGRRLPPLPPGRRRRDGGVSSSYGDCLGAARGGRSGSGPHRGRAVYRSDHAWTEQDRR